MIINDNDRKHRTRSPQQCTLVFDSRRAAADTTLRSNSRACHAKMAADGFTDMAYQGDWTDLQGADAYCLSACGALASKVHLSRTAYEWQGFLISERSSS